MLTIRFDGGAIPARPFLGLSSSDEQHIKALVRRLIEG